MSPLVALKEQLDAIDQGHVLNFVGTLSDEEMAVFSSQIASIDLDTIPALVQQYVLTPEEFKVPDGLQPPEWYPRDPDDSQRPYDAAKYRAIGEDLIRRGKVAAFCVAGGQGSRLGWDGPKGTFPATPVNEKPLFQLFAEQILHCNIKYDRDIPLFIMTSPMNHGDTVAFFNEHHYFGLKPSTVRFFPQGIMPAFDRTTGQLLLADNGSLAFSPDGHGGSLRALSRSGAIESMREQGIELVSYFQVDNPHVNIIDPLFFGLHYAADNSSNEMSSKMLPKTGPREKLGNFCRTADGRTTIIEYSDLPDDLADLRDDEGSLQFGAGSLAIHCISVSFIERLNDPNSDIALPWHRAEKKVPHVNSGTGQHVEVDTPNAVKLEMFIFDALPLCKNSIILETDRIEEFAPIKNATGVDSVESSRIIQTERAARWLAPFGVGIPRRDETGEVDAKIEICPLSATEAGDLATCDLPTSIAPGESLAL